MEVGIIIKDQYQVVEHIGRGGMADVWSARDQRLNRLVAIKTIAQSLSTEADPVALFQQEAQTIAQMEHPHILPIYDFGEFRNNLYIVMRYVTGGSLGDKLEDDPLTLQETLQIGGNIAKALDYAHEKNVIHLDLKPPNILMDSGGSPYLADFGLATVLDKQGRARNPGSGTLLYMAPEQLVAEVIDHRADIYSFSVMIWHMLTGTLPFNGMTPLAMKQLQFQDELPSLDQFNEEIPYQITDILRQGTSVDADRRPSSLTEMIEQMRAIVESSTIDMDSSWIGGDFEGSFGLDSALTLDITDVGLMEAEDIYTRAKHVWSGGNGRFLLGVSHFMMMCDYYMNASENGLELDDAGRQMILRGALEYDYHIDYWWDAINNDGRRWVCLHTVRSENAPARIRALYRLETLPDDPQAPTIPKLVANALSIETNNDAKLAALTVLSTRSKLVKPKQNFNIKTEYRGQLLNTTTRLGIEFLPVDVWQEAIYTPEIDALVAEVALKDDEDDIITEYAARTIGIMHSLTALRVIADAQRQNAPNALRSLALIRDEAPYLPDVVPPQARLYAWIANTIRRISDDPMQLVLRFIFALLGGAIGFGQHVYITYRSQALFVPQRWGNTLAVGLLMGLFIAILVMFADALISRLRGFWPNWLRLIASIGFGILFGTLTWTGFTWLYLNQPPVWDLMRMGGMGLTFGLIASTMFRLKSWQSFIITTASVFLSIFAAYYNNCTQLYICFADSSFNLVEGVTNFSISPVALIGMIFGTILGIFIPHSWSSDNDSGAVPLYGMTQFGGLIVLLSISLGSTWFIYSQILGEMVVSWDQVILLFIIPTIASAIGMVLLETPQRILYAVIGILGFVLMMTQIQDRVAATSTLIAPQFGADYVDALFSYDLYWQSFTVGFPVALVIGFGAFAIGIFGDLRRIIGEPAEWKERNAWLTGILLYVLTISALVTVLAPFSMHRDIPWSIGWTTIGAITFVCGLASWQWKRWGARGLLVCTLLFVVGGFLADYRDAVISAQDGIYPYLFKTQSIIFWGLWSVVTGIMTVGVLRHKLWGAFSLVIMIPLWFIVSLFLNDLGDSLTALALVHAPIVAYALRFDWHQFEGRQRKEKANQEDAPIQETLTQETPTQETPTPKFTPVVTIEDEVELASETDLEVANPVLHARNLATELDPQHILDDTDTVDESTRDLPTEINPADAMRPIDLKTEFDPQSTISPPDADTTDDIPEVQTPTMATELDPQNYIETDKPKFKLTTDKLQNSETNPEQKPKFKIDTGLMKTKRDEPSEVKPPSASSRRGLKIDTSLLGSKRDEPSEDKPPSASSRRGLKIDTSLLGSKRDEPEPTKTDAEENADPTTKDDTLPSRPTLKFSTSDIKKQIEEEQAKSEAVSDNPPAKEDKEEQPPSPKPKFKLNTSRVKKEPSDDDNNND